MRKREHRVQVRLDDKEHSHFLSLVKRSGITQEVYLRHLINGLMPNDAPPPDYYSMMKELHKIGNNLNQIATKAHVLNVLDTKRYDEAYRLFQDTVSKITSAVILPHNNL